MMLKNLNGFQLIRNDISNLYFVKSEINEITKNVGECEFFVWHVVIIAEPLFVTSIFPTTCEKVDITNSDLLVVDNLNSASGDWLLTFKLEKTDLGAITATRSEWQNLIFFERVTKLIIDVHFGT